MRENLECINDIRDVFYGIFVRIGIKKGYMGKEETVLLKDIRDKNGKYICDHLWFNYTKGFQEANLHEGDIVEFNARVKPYIKGYFGYQWDVYKPAELDYKLSHPTKFKKINDSDNY